MKKTRVLITNRTNLTNKRGPKSKVPKRRPDNEPLTNRRIHWEPNSVRIVPSGFGDFELSVTQANGPGWHRNVALRRQTRMYPVALLNEILGLIRQIRAIRGQTSSSSTTGHTARLVLLVTRLLQRQKPLQRKQKNPEARLMLPFDRF